MTNLSKSVLYLASLSAGRRQLLNDAGIAYNLTFHTSDEIIPFKKGMTAEEYTQLVASLKMEYVVLPEVEKEHDVIWVVVADTMVQGVDGTILGKPTSVDEARKFYRLMNGNWSTVATSFIVRRLCVCGGVWKVEQESVQTVSTAFFVAMIEKDIEDYLTHKGDKIFSYSSGLDVVGFGAQFVVQINGSYTNVIGLPMHEVVQALKNLGWRA